MGAPLPALAITPPRPMRCFADSSCYPHLGFAAVRAGVAQGFRRSRQDDKIVRRICSLRTRGEVWFVLLTGLTALLGSLLSWDTPGC
jgi:hypothetical protein